LGESDDLLQAMIDPDPSLPLPCFPRSRVTARPAEHSQDARNLPRIAGCVL
jgi:hypothetical protein